jgi:hypothetical protein
MQLGSNALCSVVARIASLVCLGTALGTSGSAAAGEFEAFTWARHHPPSTQHVSALIQIDPWTNLEQAAATLKALPEGKRFVVFQGITDDLADHPSDRVVERSWEIRTRQVAVSAARALAGVAGSTVAPAAKSTPVMASQGRAPAGAVSSKSMSVASASRIPTQAATTSISERVPVDRLTQFRGPWMDNGIATVRARVQGLMRRLVSLGAPIDGIVLSNETTLHAACFLGRDGALAAIQNDPRWPALARSMGLSTTIVDMDWGTDKYFQWTERMSGRFDAAMNQAVYAPIRAFYPNAAVSNYCTGRVTAAFASPDINGHHDRRQTAGFGSHDNSEFYAWLPPSRIARVRGDGPLDEGWLAFRVEMHKIRGMNASSARPKHAWIAQRSWQGETWGPVAIDADPLWDELVLQLGMHGVRQFLELSIEDFSMTREANLTRRTVDRAALNALLEELNARVSGSGSGVLVAAQPSWNDRVIATGRRVDGRVVWRFSFAPGVDAVKVRFTDGSDAIVEVEPGRRGAWLEHSASSQLVLDPSGQVPSFEVVSMALDGSQPAGE